MLFWKLVRRVVFFGGRPTRHIVDGSEIRRSPPGMYKTLYIMGIFTISIGAGFFHQQYHQIFGRVNIQVTNRVGHPKMVVNSKEIRPKCPDRSGFRKMSFGKASCQVLC